MIATATTVASTRLPSPKSAAQPASAAAKKAGAAIAIAFPLTQGELTATTAPEPSATIPR